MNTPNIDNSSYQQHLHAAQVASFFPQSQQGELTSAQRPSSPSAIAQAQEIAQFNNQGIWLLNAGHFAASLSSFSRAIQKLRVLLHCSDCPPETSLLQVEPLHLNHPQLSSPDDSNKAPQDHNPLALCPVAFRLVLPNCHMTNTTRYWEGQERKNVAWISASLLYNIALSRQLCAKSHQTTGSCHQEYKSSARFYAMAAAALRHLDASEDEASPSHFQMHSSLMLAIHNNWAHISVQIFDLTTSHHCRNVLRQVLSSLSLYYYKQEEDVSRKTVVMNLLFLEGKRNSAAGA
mmetsp:Transcript_7349/g.16237  ORF Transcript_7349/g.16237 Transcript_7349/m.16237 type:complete len:291 (-) Transcript_7349:105-977(-)